MAFTTMRGPNLSETKLVFDKPVTTQPPADFSPLVIKADDAFIKGLHSYEGRLLLCRLARVYLEIWAYVYFYNVSVLMGVDRPMLY